MLAFVLVALLQPVFSYRVHTRHVRFIAVLLDDSASMLLTDRQSTPAEKLELARFFDLPFIGHPLRLEDATVELAGLWRDFESELAALPSVAAGQPEVVASQLRRRREPLARLAERAQTFGTVQRQNLVGTIHSPPNGDAKIKQALESLRDRFTAVLDGEVTEVRKLIATEPSAALTNTLAPLRAQLQKTIQDVEQLLQQMAPLPASLAETTLASFSPSQVEELDKLAKKTRQAIARRVLLDTPGKPSLLDELGKDHAVKLYRFASDAKATDAQRWRSEEGTAASGDAGEGVASWRQATDLAAALSQVQQDIPADHLAGVLILSDGRHNHGAPAEPLARKLGQSGVPVCSVVLAPAALRLTPPWPTWSLPSRCFSATR
jgi:hypothetical protein